MVTFSEAKQLAYHAIEGLIPVKAKENDKNWLFALNFPKDEPQLIFDIPIYCVPKNGEPSHEAFVGTDEFIDFQRNSIEVPLNA